MNDKPFGLDDLFKTMEQVARIPKPALSYIVLDHTWSPSLPPVKGEDAQGRNYVLCSPAMLDEFQHVKQSEMHPGITVPESSFTGVFIYRRENMPEGWPDA